VRLVIVDLAREGTPAGTLATQLTWRNRPAVDVVYVTVSFGQFFNSSLRLKFYAAVKYAGVDVRLRSKIEFCYVNLSNRSRWETFEVYWRQII